MDLFKQGPNASGVMRYLFLWNKSSVLCQPSLSCHDAVILFEGLSLVLVWEAQGINVDVSLRSFNSFGVSVREVYVE